MYFPLNQFGSGGTYFHLLGSFVNMIVDSNFIPLHVATENSHVEMITFFIEKGARF